MIGDREIIIAEIWDAARAVVADYQEIDNAYGTVAVCSLGKMQDLSNALDKLTEVTEP